MALKYPFGAGSAPVVAPTTGSATTVFKTEEIVMRPIISLPMQLTSNDGIRTQFDKLILELFPESLDILFVALTRFLESLRIRWRDMVKIITIKDGLVRRPTGWIHSET